MRRKVLVIIAVILILTFCTGCYDANEIGDLTYVSILGIERGVSDRLRITFKLQKFSQEGGGSSQKGTGANDQNADKDTLTIDASSLLTAVAAANTNLSKLLNFMHLKMIVISEELAKEGGIGEFVTPLIRYRQIRRSTKVAICKGTAQEFVNTMQPYSGNLMAQTIEEMVKNSKRTGYFPDVSLNDVYSNLKSYCESAMVIYGAVNKGANFIGEGDKYSGATKIQGDYYAGDAPKTQGQDFEFLGSVLLDGDKMVGKLTGFETQMILMIRGDINRAVFAMPDPYAQELIIPIEVKEFESPIFSMDLSGDKPKINVKLGLEGNITVVQSKYNYESPELKKVVEKEFEEYIKKGIERVFSKCKVFKTDVFEFGNRASMQFLTIPEWEEYNWLTKFPESELKVDVNFIVRRTGKMIKSMPIISSEGKK